MTSQVTSQVTHFVYLTLVFRLQSKPAFCSLSFRPDLAHYEGEDREEESLNESIEALIIDFDSDTQE